MRMKKKRFEKKRSLLKRPGNTDVDANCFHMKTHFSNLDSTVLVVLQGCLKMLELDVAG